MKRVNGREKGKRFERRIAKLIAKALSATEKQVYRTPNSGGHPYAERGDLVIAPKLLKRFPFCVECKCVRSWGPEKLLEPDREMHAWMAQATRAAEQCGLTPMLVVTGSHSRSKGATTGAGKPVQRGRRMGVYCLIRLAEDHQRSSGVPFSLRRSLAPLALVPDAAGRLWLALTLPCALSVVQRSL